MGLLRVEGAVGREDGCGGSGGDWNGGASSNSGGNNGFRSNVELWGY